MMQTLRNILKTKSQTGFTIVELSIVIVVIGILASVVVVGGGSYLDRAAKSNIETSLVAAQAEMKKVYNRKGSYPLAIPSSVVPASGVTLSISSDNNDVEFCITGAARSFLLHIDQDDTKPQSGSCSGYVGPDPGGGDPDPDPDPEPDPEPEGFSISADMEDIYVQPGNGMDPVLVEVSISGGGTPPYTYQILPGASEVYTEDIGSWFAGIYLVWSDEVPGSGGLENSLIVIPPEHPSVDLPDNTMMVGSLVGDDFAALCSLWPSSETTMPFKLEVTDAENNTAEANFNFACIEN